MLSVKESFHHTVGMWGGEVGKKREREREREDSWLKNIAKCTQVVLRREMWEERKEGKRRRAKFLDLIFSHTEKISCPRGHSRP